LNKTQTLTITKIFLTISFLIFFVIVSCDKTNNKTDPKAETSKMTENTQNQNPEKLPMLVDLGKGTCIPCKKMKPILEELKTEYQGKAIVRIIDLRDEPKEASKYGIRLIPTQIFFDAEGKEVYRHEGFMDKQSIKAKFAEMGVY
jgi:thioredoxin 1